MSNLIVTSPQRPYIFPDSFKAVANGDVYAGLVDKDPLIPSNQIKVYVVGEDGSETPVSQPLKINSGGLLVYNGQPSKFIVKQNYSMLVERNGTQVFYEPNMAFIDPEALSESVWKNDSYVSGGVIYPKVGMPPLKLGKQSTVIDYTGVSRILLETDYDSGETELLYLWDLPSGFYDVKHQVLDVKKSNTGGYIVTTDHGQYTFLSINEINYRGGSPYSGAVINPKGWGVKSGDSIQNDTQLTAMIDYLKSYPGDVAPAIEWDAGVYAYYESPNWAINRLKMDAKGEVRFRCLGLGDCVTIDDPTGTTFDIQMGWGTRFYVEGTKNSRNGVYVRSIHHSKLGFNVRGCGATALHIDFSVVNEYDIICSINEGAWYLDAKPKRGIIATRRGEGEDTSANIFNNPIIEGVSAVGITCDYALNNRFEGGTSEGNGAHNVECTVNSKNNSFKGTDFEASGTSQDVIDRGRWNNWIEIYSDSTFTVTSTAKGCNVYRGLLNNISNVGEGSTFNGVQYGLNGGSFSDTGVNTEKVNVYRHVTNNYDDNQTRNITIGNGTNIKGHWWRGIESEFPAPAQSPGTVTMDFVFSEAKVGDTIHVDIPGGIKDNFMPPQAWCQENGKIKVRWAQIYGQAEPPTDSPVTYRIEVWRH